MRKLEEEELANTLSPGVGAAGHDQPAEEKPVKILLTAPAEAPAATGDENKEYPEEFYPVVKPHHDEPHKPPLH